MRRFFTFGDSWARGVGVRCTETYSWQIAQHLGLVPKGSGGGLYYNLGMGGNSNKNIAEQILNMKFKKDDVILITWTTPHRDDRKHNKYFQIDDTILLDNFPKHIRRVEEYLDGYNYTMTQCFNPIFGYDYKLTSEIDGSNFIEWGKKNNTLVDVLTDRWCDDTKENRWMLSDGNSFEYQNRFIDKHDNHPNVLGHNLIAEHLLKYMEK